MAEFAECHHNIASLGQVKLPCRRFTWASPLNGWEVEDLPGDGWE